MELRSRELDLAREQFQRSMLEMEQRFTADREARSQEQEVSERARDRRLTRAAIWFAVILGVAQIVAQAVGSIWAMTPDSFGARLLSPRPAIQEFTD